MPSMPYSYGLCHMSMALTAYAVNVILIWHIRLTHMVGLCRQCPWKFGIGSFSKTDSQRQGQGQGLELDLLRTKIE